ncbi:Inward rectifier potassium channel Kirbac3.1 [Dolichospermum sp. UHCC 0315A]|jgi:inward rectifier potassium channel|nr:Inward rectifier potassium channel Kirbac3.1 [Dolichospermum sp. UHCC 0315A]
MHIIDESSPFHGMTSALLSQTQALLMISMSGIDETVAQVVHARYSYGVNEILWNHQFVDIMYYNTPDRHRYCDYTHFHDVLPIY